MNKLEEQVKAKRKFLKTLNTEGDIPLNWQMAKELGVHRTTLYDWKREWLRNKDSPKERKRPKIKERKLIENTEEDREPLTEANELARQIREMDEAVFGAATSGNKVAKMAELWYRRHGLLVDKSISLQKVKVELSEDDREFIRGEAGRRDAEFNRGRNREGALLPESTILPGEIREG